MLCSFNTNICNGTKKILNPKKIKQKKLLENKIKTANQRITQYQNTGSECEKNSEKKRYEKQIENQSNKMN